MNGIEVLATIRAHEETRLIPVVVLTSSKQDEDLITSYHLGVNACVRKPVRSDEFNDAIGTLGLFWLLLNEPPPLGNPAR